MREAHRQLLDRDVVHDLVVGALQEGRVDRAERLEALGRQAGGEGHGVLLGDADVEGAVRERLAEQVEPGAGRHRGGDGDDLVVLARLLDQALGEHLGVGSARSACGLACAPVTTSNLTTPWYLSADALGRRVALALLRHDVDQDRPGRRRRARSSAPAADGRGCARRSGRHSRSRAPRTACRRSQKPRAYSSRARSRRSRDDLRQLARELLADVAQRPDRCAPETSRAR